MKTFSPAGAQGAAIEDVAPVEARSRFRACGPAPEASVPAGVVSIARCREVLGESVSDWSDAQVLALRERLVYLADLAVDLAASAERKAA